MAVTVHSSTGKFKQKRFEGKGRGPYLLDSKEEKKEVKDSQWSVRWRLWLFKLMYYTAWLCYALPYAFGKQQYRFEWTMVTIAYAAVVMFVAYGVYQSTFYLRVLPSGLSSEGEGRFSWLVWAAIGLGLLTGLAYGVTDPGWGVVTGGAIVVASVMIVFLVRAGPVREKPKKPELPVNIKAKGKKKDKNKETGLEEEEGAEKESTQQLAVRTINGTPVPSDVLGPGRYEVINFFGLVVGIQTKEVAGKMDIDVKSAPVFSKTAKREELVLHLRLLYRWPANNPVHLVAAFDLPGVNAARDALDGPVNSAAIVEIRKYNYATLTDSRHRFLAANKKLFGRELTDEELDYLGTRDPKTAVYCPIGIEIVYLDWTVEGTDKQKEIWRLESTEQGQRNSETTDAVSTIIIAERIKKEAKNRKIKITDAQAQIMAQRIQKHITTQELRITTGPELERFFNIVAGLLNR